ncbi:hypothetical protein LSH36_1582g00012 [Paralvinella palmiformis]|uniref:Uncharacterized protein n=1 Tax=Paralvinella palmiformis TaxID=53620 RepID=A0AAD9ITA5_9ANNE|nr:hypothetical protein LSH36_1582g00012 [Paralvinella palmiformis]
MKSKRFLLLIVVLMLCRELVKAEQSISDLPNAYGLDKKNGKINWIYNGKYEKIEWYRGNVEDELIMNCIYPCSSVSKSPKYENIDYLNETNSVGIVIHNLNTSFSDSIL